VHQDGDNTDYKDGRLFVFDDRLGFDDDVKYQLEATLDYPFEDRTTFRGSVEPSVLTAEKKRKPDGSHYILVRKATFPKSVGCSRTTMTMKKLRSKRAPQARTPPP
jgi:hypothetical protein